MTSFLGWLVWVAALMGMLLLTAGWALGRNWPPARGRRPTRPQRHGARYLREAANQLSDAVADVAHDVGRHQGRIQAFSQELSAAQSGEEGRQAESLLRSVAEILQINARLQDRLQTAETRLRHQAKQIESWMAAARTDPGTGLPNRRAFDAALARHLAHGRRTGSTFCLVLLDLDHFKAINDRHGHGAGDWVLRAVADLLERTFRKGDLVARLGGEEFAVLLPATDTAAACRAAETCRAAVASHAFRREDFLLPLTVSLGVASVQSGDDPGSLLDRADQAMYAAKRAGRNCTYVHNGQDCVPISKHAPSAGAPPAGSAASEPDETNALAAACQRLRLRLAEVVGEDA